MTEIRVQNSFLWAGLSSIKTALSWVDLQRQRETCLSRAVLFHVFDFLLLNLCNSQGIMAFFFFFFKVYIDKTLLGFLFVLGFCPLGSFMTNSINLTTGFRVASSVPLRGVECMERWAFQGRGAGERHIPSFPALQRGPRRYSPFTALRASLLMELLIMSCSAFGLWERPDTPGERRHWY